MYLGRLERLDTIGHQDIGLNHMIVMLRRNLNHVRRDAIVQRVLGATGSLKERSNGENTRVSNTVRSFEHVIDTNMSAGIAQASGHSQAPGHNISFDQMRTVVSYTRFLSYTTRTLSVVIPPCNKSVLSATGSLTTKC